MKFSTFLLSSVLWLGAVSAAPPDPIAQVQESAQSRSLEDLSSAYDAFILDAQGVFWESGAKGLYPGAADAMRYLVSQGRYVGILSNTTQIATKEKEKLKKHGVYEGIHYHFLLSSGEVFRNKLMQQSLPFPTPRHTYWVFGTLHPHFSPYTAIFEGTGYEQTENLEEADFIYITIPHIDGVDQTDPEVFRKKIESIDVDLPVLCANPDCFAMEGNPPRPVVRQGTIAQLFKELGFQVYLIGKPYQEVYEVALQNMPPHIAKDKILMIGDTPGTDIRGAHNAGIKAALVTQTGILAKRIAEEGIAPTLEQFPATDQPEFLLDRLHTQAPEAN